MEVRPELLAVLDVEAGVESGLDLLRQVGTVTQQLPPRLALVVLAAGTPTPVLPGISWHDTSPPAAVVPELSEPEQTFVDAWAVRVAGKSRPHDGDSWDTPGLRPPDEPTVPP